MFALNFHILQTAVLFHKAGHTITPSITIMNTANNSMLTFVFINFV